MRHLTVTGLSEDGTRLVLRAGGEMFDVPWDEVRRVSEAQEPRPAPCPTAVAPSPREVQQRIRAGESAAEIAQQAGVPLALVARYEGPVLAEREYHADQARRALVDGRLVDELVDEHLTRMLTDPPPAQWDAWLVEPGRWEVRVRADTAEVRLRWEPATRRVSALGEASRQVLRQAPLAQDALDAVLRPLAGRSTPSPRPTPAPRSGAARQRRPQIPTWEDITGTAPAPSGGEEDLLPYDDSEK